MLHELWFDKKRWTQGVGSTCELPKLLNRIWLFYVIASSVSISDISLLVSLASSINDSSETDISADISAQIAYRLKMLCNSV